ncbi:MAG: SPOR domain-containing protein [Thermodesulfobacteriota bacterium]
MVSGFKQRKLLVMGAIIFGVMAIVELCGAPSLNADSLSGEREGVYTIQTGTYDYSPYAVEQLTFISDNLKDHGLTDMRVIEFRKLFAVRVGRFSSRAAAHQHLRLLKTLYPDAFVLNVRNEKVFHVLEKPLQPPLRVKKSFIEVVVKMTDFKFIPSHLDLETDRLYKLKLVNIGKTKREFDSALLSEKVFTRKIVVVDKKGNMIVEIKGKPTELELAPGQAVEWWFVPMSVAKELI